MLMPLFSSPAKYSAILSAGTGVPPSPPMPVVTPISSLLSARPFLRQHAARLVQHVDPAGRDVFAARVDLAFAFALDLADADEATVLDRDVCRDPRVARAVEHAAVADHDVVGGRDVLRRDRHAQGDAQREQADECAEKVRRRLFIIYAASRDRNKGLQP